MSRLKNPVTKCSRYDETIDYDTDSDDYSDEDEFDSDSEPPAVRPTYKGARPRYPPSKPTGRKHTRYGVPMDTMSSTTTTSSVLSSPLETTEDTTGSNPSDLYAPIRREKRPMIMEQEISPVRSQSEFMDFLPPRLHLHREWRPQHTSTTTDMQPLFAMPKTNPRFGPSLSSSTPKRRFPPLTPYNQVMSMEPSPRPKSYYDVEKDPNLVWDNTRPQSAQGIRPTLYEDFNLHRGEAHGLPPGYAKNKGLSGILFLTMSICGHLLTVTIRNAIYFTERHQLDQFNTYVKLEIKEKKHSGSQSSRKRPPPEGSSHREVVSSQGKRSQVLRKTNKPEFRETFQFQLDPSGRSHRQVLFISVHSLDKESGAKKQTRMLGCMTFPISRMLVKVQDDAKDYYYKENTKQHVEEIIVNDGGFFLMDAKNGEKNNFPQNKIKTTRFYDDPTLSGSGCGLSSYSSSNLTSSRQMPMEEFVTASRQFGSSMIPGYGTSSGPHQPLDNSSASSSSSFRHYNGRHRQTYPNINTNIVITSDSSEHDGFSGISCQPTDMDHLYADNNMNERKFRRGGSPSPIINTKHVRRATSFTFSPKDTMDKYNKRPAQAKEKDEKKKSGPLAKFFSVLRSKKDSSSTSSLYLAKENCPSKEEIYDWENNFELLLKSELGCQLFRSFLLKEHSDENWEFWSACEEFKRMKDGEKSTQKRGHEIYEKYIQENACRQVNLDSDTRAATKAALECGCRADSFNLAQTQIEHLMRTDTYKRFLQDPVFLDLKQAVAEQRPASESST